jgi:hypothetical protein
MARKHRDLEVKEKGLKIRKYFTNWVDGRYVDKEIRRA